MPQNRKPPRLWLRSDRDRKTGETVEWWVIRDGAKQIRTGCPKTEVEAAEKQLHDYLASKYEPKRGGRASEITIADVLIVYAEDKSEKAADPQIIARLNDFMGHRLVSDIKAKLCREFAAFRRTPSGARRDLEVLRAATNHYHKEHGLDVAPRFTLPPKSLPRERYLTRSEAAALLLACMGWKLTDGKWRRSIDRKRKHLARMVLIGIYTGTRPGAIRLLQWMPNTTGGRVDLDKGVIFRRAEGERVAHNKRRTPVKIAPRLLVHLKRWKALDNNLRFVINYQGRSGSRPHGAFRNAVKDAGLGAKVTPHVLRHTRGTWLAQRGVPAIEAAASLGLTTEEYERTYLHNDPSFQEKAARAF